MSKNANKSKKIRKYYCNFKKIVIYYVKVVEKWRKDVILKTFFDGIFISKEHLEEAGIKYPIKLEYYKIARDENVKNTNQVKETENTKGKYGIEVVKTEYLDGNVKIETKEVSDITNDINEADRILTLLRNNEVTPIGVEDVLEDLQKV